MTRWIVAFICLIGVSASGFYYLQQKEILLSAENPDELSQGLIKDFAGKARPLFPLTEESLFFPLQREQVDPGTLLPQTHKYSFKEIKLFDQAKANCQSNAVLNSPLLRRGLEFERWMNCSPTSAPPEFMNSAQMHPYGGSYNLRASKILARNKNYLHLFEMTKEEKLSFENPLLLLTKKEIWSLMRNEEIVLTSDYLILRKEKGDRGQEFELRIFSREAFEDFLGETPFHLLASGKGCLISGQTFCLKLSTKERREMLKISRNVFLGLSLLLLLLLIFGLLRSIKQRKEAQETKEFIVETLAHEIRTPTTSLTLIVESLRDQFDELPEKAQDDFLRLSQEVTRLKQLSEASRNYLQAAKEKRGFALNFQRLESLNQFVKACSTKISEDIQFSPSATDIAFKSDPYWLNLGLKLLVENALDHGVKPVQVSTQVTGKTISVSVKDAGKIEKSLQDLTEAFHKGKESQGMGLGLFMVQKITKELGGRLKIKPNPTEFILEWEQS